ncbi:MAG: aspartate--tRNA ligase [Candidatus Woesearchaeota archaeon]
MTSKTAHRTHTCSQLTKSDISTTVKLSGWVHSRRDHGGIIFIDLRDSKGITQIVFDPEFAQDVFAQGEKLRREDVITISGEVKARADDLINKKIPTGEIEVFVSNITVINKSQTPPFEIEDSVNLNEDLRLEYRYLDLRRPNMQEKLRFRHDFLRVAREVFHNYGFTEVDTPLLIKSTPEGARDYVVPSRVNKGSFYALPQSPQLYKQLLMVSGVDRYYQIAKCLRDEDLRSDRQPEHTQMDFEMSFVSQEDVRSFVEQLYAKIFFELKGITLQTPFPVISYKESMDKYGIDKPDIRFDLHLSDVTDIVKESDFGVFKAVAQSGGIIKCINPPTDIPRKEVDRYIEYCQKIGSKGMAWMRVTENGLESNIAKYFSQDIQTQLIQKVGAKPGSMVFFIADKPAQCNDIIARLRLKLGEDLNLIPKDTYAFCWINDFPLFEWNPDEKKWDAMHNMFVMPKKEWVEKISTEPENVLGDLFDIVLNGVELGSGAIRVSQPDIQKEIMKVVGFDEEEAQDKFGFLLKAYQYGGPIHAGMGLGLDRSIALLLGTHDIREVIAFPKNKHAQCPMDGSPSQISEQQLKELSLKLDISEQK